MEKKQKQKKKQVSEYVCLVEGCSHAQKVKHTMLREPSCSVGGNVNWYNHNEEQHGGSLKNYVYNYPMIH